MQKANPGTGRKKAKSNNKAAPLLIIPWFYNTSSSRQEVSEGFPWMNSTWCVLQSLQDCALKEFVVCVGKLWVVCHIYPKQELEKHSWINIMTHGNKSLTGLTESPKVSIPCLNLRVVKRKWVHRGKGDNKLGLFLTHCLLCVWYQSSMWELSVLWATGWEQAVGCSILSNIHMHSLVVSIS